MLASVCRNGRLQLGPILVALAVLASCRGTTHREFRRQSEAVIDRFFSAIRAGDERVVRSLFGGQFSNPPSDAAWGKTEEMRRSRLGVLKKYELRDWKVE